jgi:hypothetical protein
MFPARGKAGSEMYSRDIYLVAMSKKDEIVQKQLGSIFFAYNMFQLQNFLHGDPAIRQYPHHITICISFYTHAEQISYQLLVIFSYEQIA